MNLSEKINEEGAVFLIDKEEGWTSFDAVRKIRNTLKVKKVGHAGTLDPLATGLLIVCAGKKTKEIANYQGLEKEYTGIIELGKTTPSFDLETAFDSQKGIAGISENEVKSAAATFQGEILQSPPVYSAIKIKGQRAYHIARKGGEAHIKPKPVAIRLFEFTAIQLPYLHFRLVCSKGFYVRSLARDLGEKLGTGAYLKTLRREKIGEFSVENAMKIEEFVAKYQIQQA